MPVIAMNNVEKSYNQRPLFTGVTLQINQGEAVGLQGPNGSGKSVLLKLMVKFIEPDSGTVTIDPKYLSAKRVFPEKFGVIIDKPGYIPSFTGFQNLKSLAKIRDQIDDQKIRDTMELVGLDPDLPQRVKHYSLGMKQRLGLAQAIMEDQEVLVLDEPFNGLDRKGTAEIRELLQNLVHEGKTLVMTSHNQQDIDIICGRVFEINDTQIEEI